MKKLLIVAVVTMLMAATCRTKEVSQAIMSEQAEEQTKELRRIANELEKLNNTLKDQNNDQQRIEKR